MTRTHLVLLIVFVSLSLVWQFVVERQPATSSPPSITQNPAAATKATPDENHTLMEASKPANADDQHGASLPVQQPEALKNSPADASPVTRPDAGNSPRNSKDASPEKSPTPSAEKRWIVAKQTIKDLQGKVVYRGDIDLTETITRIEAGEKLRFRNDGSVFQNRERRLPTREAGYYREWVHPTAALDGPGPQRIITGKSGEIYYTADHYGSFKKLK